MGSLLSTIERAGRGGLLEGRRRLTCIEVPAPWMLTPDQLAARNQGEIVTVSRDQLAHQLAEDGPSLRIKAWPGTDVITLVAEMISTERRRATVIRNAGSAGLWRAALERAAHECPGVYDDSVSTVITPTRAKSSPVAAGELLIIEDLDYPRTSNVAQRVAAHAEAADRVVLIRRCSREKPTSAAARATDSLFETPHRFALT